MPDSKPSPSGKASAAAAASKSSSSPAPSAAAPSKPSGASKSAGPETYLVDGVEYSVHPLALLFPAIEGAEFDEFVADVERRGIDKPVLRRGTEIIDGRTRVRAALAANKKVPFVDLPQLVHPAAAIMTANLIRRQFTPSQRAVIAKKLRDEAPEAFAPPTPRVSRAARPVAPEGNGGASSSSSSSAAPSAADEGSPPPDPPDPKARRLDPDAQARKAVAAKVGVSEVYQRQAEHVAKDAPELMDPIAKGDITVRDAHAVRGEDPQLREAALQDVRAGREKTAVAAVESRTGRAPKAQPPSQRRKQSPSPAPDAGASSGLPTMPTVPPAGRAGAAPAVLAGSAPPAPLAPSSAAPLTGANPDMLTPTLLLAGLRGVLGDIDLDPCSNADAQDRIGAGDWYSEEQDGLKQVWKGVVWAFPSLAAAPSFAQKLTNELRGGAVTRAGLLAPVDLSQAWAAKLLEVPSFSALVVERARGVYDVAGASEGARCPVLLAAYLFGLKVSPEKLVKAVGPWGRVLVNAPGQTA